MSKLDQIPPVANTPREEMLLARLAAKEEVIQQLQAEAQRWEARVIELERRLDVMRKASVGVYK
jgi:hypothetical protein